MPDNQSKIIEIAKVDMKMFDSGTQYKITTTTNEKYKFYDKKKDGNPTVAFKQFQDMELKIGSTVDVWYKEEVKEYEGKPYTDRLIASFKEASGKPAQTAIKTPSQPKYEATELKDEKFWDKKAYKQCLWGYWLEHHTAFKNVSLTDGSLGDAEMDMVWQVFNQIEKDADKRFSTGWAKAEAIFGDEAPLPTDVPF
jgi:hypothetical protein